MIENSGDLHGVDAMVFDAYGTLFDVQSVASTAEALFPGRGAARRLHNFGAANNSSTVGCRA